MLLVRFSRPAPEDTWNRMRELLDRIETVPEAADIPIRWNFTSRLPDEGRIMNVGHSGDRLVRRVESGGDRMIPSGRFGGCHPLYSDEEIRADLTPPFPSGTWFPRIGSNGIEALYPTAPDPCRAGTVYSDAAPGLPVLLGEGIQEGKRFLLGIRDGRPVRVPLVRFPLAGEERFSRRVSRILRDTHSFCALFDAAQPACADQLAELLAFLVKTRKKPGSIRFASIEELLETGGSSPEAAFPPPLTPAHRFLGLELAAIRSTAQDAGTDAILERSLSLPGREAGSDVMPGRYDWNMIAHMPGSVLLRDREIEVRFLAGRIASIKSGNSEILQGRSARSYIAFGGEEAEFFPDGAFSLQSDGIFGLQARLSTTHPDLIERGSLAVTCFFAEGYPFLIIHLQGRYPQVPEAAPVWSYAPFELPLFPFEGNPVRIEAEGAGGKPVTGVLDGSRSEVLLTGETFHVTDGSTSCMVHFPSLGPLRREHLSARIDGSGTRSIVTVSPAGSYRPVPAQLISGFREEVLLVLAVGNREELHPVELPEEVQRILKPDQSGPDRPDRPDQADRPAPAV